MSSLGFLRRAAAIIPKPKGPAPAITTTWSNSDVAALNGVDGAGQGFNKGGVGVGDGIGHAVVERLGRQKDVLGHGSEGFLAEAVDVVGLAHPVLATLAVAAQTARHDLLGDNAVAHGQAVLFGRAWA